MSRRRGAIVLDKPVAGLRDRSERQRKADEDDELFLETNIDDKREVCSKSQEERVRGWQSMRLFVATYKKNRNLEQIWLDLCRDDPEAKAIIRSYLFSRLYRNFGEGSPCHWGTRRRGCPDHYDYKGCDHALEKPSCGGR
ncbi:hypothetical protein VTK26DRAFT_5967 [Humicola hyalothermophila]